ncbi:MAG: hypothetical protein L6R19_17340 [Alphaproteobacteria bacterium]|nr:hypothetical protein [Alphaproteobacteria bacterium]
MSQLQDEIDANHLAFFKSWTKEARRNWKALEKNPVYRASYRRVTALQAIKTHLVVPHYSAESAAFFFEAHNDALVSHVGASVGAWRSALQALRSSIEHALCAAYYRDHPVELELWTSGKFLIGFAELIKYAEKHPQLAKVGTQLAGLDILKSEYATLSKAVHGSAANFRMTDPISNVLLWNADPIKAAMWSSREGRTIEGISLLMVGLHSQLLQGAALSPLRSVLYFSIGASKRAKLKQALHVNISAPSP